MQHLQALARLPLASEFDTGSKSDGENEGVYSASSLQQSLHASFSGMTAVNIEKILTFYDREQFDLLD